MTEGVSFSIFHTMHSKISPICNVKKTEEEGFSCVRDAIKFFVQRKTERVCMQEGAW